MMSGLKCFFVFFSCKSHLLFESCCFFSDPAAAPSLATTFDVLAPNSRQNTKSEFTVR